jgi:hypothetical protein
MKLDTKSSTTERLNNGKAQQRKGSTTEKLNNGSLPQRGVIAQGALVFLKLDAVFAI